MIRVLLPEALFLSQPPSFPLRSAPPRSPNPHRLSYRYITTLYES